jgi:hypothetical protein
MAWILASLPFWLVGAAFLVVALVGTVQCLKTDRTGNDLMQTCLGFLVFAIGAGMFLAIAAKLSS